MFAKTVKRNIFAYEFYRRVYTFFFRLRYKTPNISLSSKIMKPRYLSNDFIFGEYGFINNGVYVCSKVKCGNYVMFGPNVTIAGSDHRFDVLGKPMYFSGRPDIPNTIIGDDVWIGANSIIKAGVKIGSGSIIGMGSLVLDDVPENSIYVGSPAKFLKKRFSDKEFDEQKIIYFQSPRRFGEYC